MIILIGYSAMAINEQALHDHKKANTEQRVIRAVLKERAYVVQNL